MYTHSIHTPQEFTPYYIYSNKKARTRLCPGFYTPCPQGATTMMPPTVPTPPLYPIFIYFPMFVPVDLFIYLFPLYYKAVTLSSVCGCKVTTIKWEKRIFRVNFAHKCLKSSFVSRKAGSFCFFIHSECRNLKCFPYLCNLIHSFSKKYTIQYTICWQILK